MLGGPGNVHVPVRIIAAPITELIFRQEILVTSYAPPGSFLDRYPGKFPAKLKYREI
jgi:hypothetical protein